MLLKISHKIEIMVMDYRRSKTLSLKTTSRNINYGKFKSSLLLRHKSIISGDATRSKCIYSNQKIYSSYCH